MFLCFSGNNKKNTSNHLKAIDCIFYDNQIINMFKKNHLHISFFLYMYIPQDVHLYVPDNKNVLFYLIDVLFMIMLMFVFHLHK